MKPGSALARHLHTFFHEYLTTQRSVSPHTALAYRDALKLLLRFAAKRLGKDVDALALEDLGVETALAFLDHLERERGNSVATRNARLAALHVFYKHVAARDPASFELCQRVLGVPVKRAPRRAVHYLEREELDAILRRIDRSRPAGRRDYAMLAFAYQTGARVEETVSVRACDLDLDLLPQVRIWGKGRKERIVPLWPGTAALLRAWIEERGIDPRGTSPVFVNLRGRPLTRWGVRYLLGRYARAAATAVPTVASKRIHPHVLRHTTAVHMLDAGADPSAIRDLFGHSSAETTWRYTRVRMERKRKTIEACAPRPDDDAAIPVWRRDPTLLAQLEAIGRRQDYVERPAPEAAQNEHLRDQLHIRRLAP
jgi:integrase/recombinase XerD